MAGMGTKTQTTKNLIIKAAFSFYSEPCYKDFSLNEIAARVGISKPAIYRHFENKDAILKEMEKTFLDLLANHLRAVHEFERQGGAAAISKTNIPFARTIQFFADNPQYINYFLTQFSTQLDYEEFLATELEKRGINKDFSGVYFWKDGAPRFAFSESFYSGTSLLFFIKIREKVCSQMHIQPSSDFAQKLITFIEGGLQGCSREGDLIFPQTISDERKAFLKSHCKINKDDLPKEDKIFSALAAVIKKYKMSGVTIERIADELHMAKSSLYFYFDNKNEMMKKLILRELSFMSEVCRENAVEAANYSEHIYISMRSEMEYLLLRPSILPICGWLMQNSTNNPFGEETEINNVWEKRMTRPLQNIDLGFPVMPEILTFWTGLIPVTMISIGEKHNLGAEEMLSALDAMFEFIQYGL
mgnify:CR=1 FL=1